MSEELTLEESAKILSRHKFMGEEWWQVGEGVLVGPLLGTCNDGFEQFIVELSQADALLVAGALERKTAEEALQARIAELEAQQQRTVQACIGIVEQQTQLDTSVYDAAVPVIVEALKGLEVR